MVKYAKALKYYKLSVIREKSANFEFKERFETARFYWMLI